MFPKSGRAIFWLKSEFPVGMRDGGGPALLSQSPEATDGELQYRYLTSY